MDAVQHCRGAARVQLDVSVATVDTVSRLGAAPPKPPGAADWWHISAHFDPDMGRLVLEDHDGCAHMVPVSANALGIVRPPLGAAVLACTSAAVGQYYTLYIYICEFAKRPFLTECRRAVTGRT